MNLVILAGGKSSRFGKDKALVKFEGVPIIERILSALGMLFRKHIIVTNHPNNYAKLGCLVAADIYKNIGPLGGLHAGLTYSNEALNFIVACDMPLIKPELAAYLIAITGYNAVVPVVKGFPEPLLAVYSRQCLAAMEEMIGVGQYKISSLYEKIDIKFVPEEELKKADPELKSFCNINHLMELKRHERTSKNNQV
ncbi:MAG: molybdenum cofactor guanylyltransferase [Candidatus Margulisbacteria bacterium]|nr:molybdenum cofactor guanylyltransferase [Candidatus Margulisiibacteriota bacterium]